MPGEEQVRYDGCPHLVAARRALYRQAYRVYREEAPWLYLYQPHRLWGIRRPSRSAVRANREAVLRFQ